MSVADFMPYYKQPDRIATVQEALTQHNVDDLKKLAAFVPGDKIPTRKNDLVEYILPHLQGASLKTCGHNAIKYNKLPLPKLFILLLINTKKLNLQINMVAVLSGEHPVAIATILTPPF
jgi:hypothetical protein